MIQPATPSHLPPDRLATVAEVQAAGRLRAYIRDLTDLLDSELSAHDNPAHRQKIVQAVGKWAVSKLPPKTAVSARPHMTIPRQPTKPPEQSADDEAEVYTSPMETRIQQALETGRQIIDDAETTDLPEAAWEFAESVSEKARGIMATIEATRVVSNKQEEALENMAAGLARWMRE